MQIFHPVTVKVKCRRDNFVPLVFAPISCVLLHFWHFALQFLWLFGVFGILLGRDLWIPGGGGVHRLVLRGAGVGNCPEIAHCHCPPSLPIAPSLLHVSTESKNAVSSPLSENTPSYRVSWHGEGSNYESNQPWNAPISCFRPCLMLEINYSHASDIIIITIDIIIVTIIPVIQ